MIITTTPNIEGKHIEEYLGLVTGEAIMGANIARDFMASVRDVVGGRAKSYEKVLQRGKEEALEEMAAAARAKGANAVIGVDLDYETVGTGSMLMIAASGTAVRYRE